MTSCQKRMLGFLTVVLAGTFAMGGDIDCPAQFRKIRDMNNGKKYEQAEREIETLLQDARTPPQPPAPVTCTAPKLDDEPEPEAPE